MMQWRALCVFLDGSDVRTHTQRVRPDIQAVRGGTAADYMGMFEKQLQSVACMTIQEASELSRMVLIVVEQLACSM